jgi:predicted Holliday junction resolvase-like endonuclease
MNTEELIKKLKESNLYAECPCGKEFKLSQAILFDGTKPFPKEALEAQLKFNQDLKEKEDKLEKSKKSIERAAISARSSNIGQKLETVAPLLKDFRWNIRDCRPLGDPIDFIAFNGFSISKIHSLSFIEVKTGNSKLSDHQEAVRDAIADKKVSYKVFK